MAKTMKIGWEGYNCPTSGYVAFVSWHNDDFFVGPVASEQSAFTLAEILLHELKERYPDLSGEIVDVKYFGTEEKHE